MCASNGNGHVSPFNGMGIPSIQMAMRSRSLHCSWHPFSLNSSDPLISRKWQGTPLPIQMTIGSPSHSSATGPTPPKMAIGSHALSI